MSTINLLKTLKVKKLFKELDWLNNNLSYNKEMLSNIDHDFMLMVESILDKYPDLKKEYKQKEAEWFIEKENESSIKIDNDLIVDSKVCINNNISKDKELKDLYRKIVKITHPDKVNNTNLNNSYINATKFYEQNDKTNLILIGIDLNIDISFINLDLEYIENKINTVKDMISFTESTYSWKWYESKSKSEKENLIIHFIKSKLIG